MEAFILHHVQTKENHFSINNEPKGSVGNLILTPFKFIWENVQVSL